MKFSCKEILLFFAIPLFAFLNIKTAKGQCVNNWCEDAIEIGCEPYEFTNYFCEDEEVCIQPNQGSTNCVLIFQENSAWFTFEVLQPNYFVFNLNTNFTSTEIPAYNYCYGTNYLEGSHWALAKGSCEDLQWMATWINPGNCNRCRCFQGNTVTWVGDCNDTAPCANPTPMQPQWNGNCPLVSEPEPPYVYDVCVQDWQVTFYLEPGTYYFIVTGFVGSTGSGIISICPEAPLCPKPIATLEGITLSWTESGTSGYKVYWVSDIITWNPILIWEGFENQITISQTGWYYIFSQCGGSNIQYANIQPISETSNYHDILGRQGVKEDARYNFVE